MPASVTLNSVALRGVAGRTEPLDILDCIRAAQIEREKMIPMKEFRHDSAIPTFVSVTSNYSPLNVLGNSGSGFGATGSTHCETPLSSLDGLGRRAN